MNLCFSYNLKHVVRRKNSVAMTVAGIALVVFVFVSTLMLSNGLKQTMAATGRDDNVIVIRNGAENEIQSGISREHINIILAEPEVERLSVDQPIASFDTVVVVTLKKLSGDGGSNVTLRGVSAYSPDLRPDIGIVEGRVPARGTREVMVGKSVQRKFAGVKLGDMLRLAGTDWPVVGVFSAGNSGFSSEIWGDVDILRPAFRRDAYSSVTFRIKAGADLDAFKARLNSDPRLNLNIERETKYYEEQSKFLGQFINLIGTVISVIFSLGAILGAMITMYSSIAHRVREIGMLRAIGFSSFDVFVAFVFECLVISFAGGVLGVALAALMSFVGVSTTNFQTFSEVAFNFQINFRIVVYGLTFSLVMGLIGGGFPAIRAARIRILNALREA